MAFRMLCLAGVTVIGLGACAPVSRPAYMELELSGIPENQAAVSMGPMKTLVQDKMRGQIELDFELGKQRFTGVMQTIDESVTTSGVASTATRTAAVGTTGGGTVGAVAAGSRQKTASSSTTAQASSKGVANAVSDKGTTMSCDYVVNTRQFSGAGTCTFSNGAKYKVFSKPLRLVMTDGSSRPM